MTDTPWKTKNRGNLNKQGHVNLAALLTDMQKRMQDENGKLPVGLGKASFYQTLKDIDEIACHVDDLRQNYTT